MECIIYGCGKCGDDIFKKLGTGRVAYFADSNSDLWGKKKFDKEIINICDILGIKEKYCIIIGVYSKKAANQIVDYLLLNNIFDFVFFDAVDEEKFIEKLDKGEINDYYEDRELLKVIKKRSQNLIDKIYGEKKYLERHTDIKNITPAIGYYNIQQKMIVKFAGDFFRSVSKLELRPILDSGNLLGLLRHGGYIPWDDDIDFLLLREDYDRLINYCKKNLFFAKYEDTTIEKNMNIELLWIKEQIENHPHEYILLMFPEHLKIVKGSSLIDLLQIDVFSMDIYLDNYSETEHFEKIDKMRCELLKTKTNREKYKIIEKYKKNEECYKDVNGSKMFYGLDNMGSYNSGYFKNRKFISREDYLPLREKEFEGEKFFIPNNPYKYIEFSYGKEWMDFPETYGDRTHLFWHEFIMNYYPVAYICISCLSQIKKAHGLYEELRKNKVYAVFVPVKNKEDIKPLISEMDNLGLEYIINPTKKSDYIYQEFGIYVKNGAKVIEGFEFKDIGWKKND